MKKQIVGTVLGAVAGYLAMAISILVTFYVAFLILGMDRLFAPGTYDASGIWIALSFVLGLGGALLGGWVASSVGGKSSAVHVMAGMVLLFGILSAIDAQSQDEPRGGARGADAALHLGRLANLAEGKRNRPQGGRELLVGETGDHHAAVGEGDVRNRFRAWIRTAASLARHSVDRGVGKHGFARLNTVERDDLKLSTRSNPHDHRRPVRAPSARNGKIGIPRDRIHRQVVDQDLIRLRPEQRGDLEIQFRHLQFAFDLRVGRGHGVDRRSLRIRHEQYPLRSEGDRSR